MEELAGWLLQPSRRSFSLRRRVAVAVRSPSRVRVRQERKAARSRFELYPAEPADPGEHQRDLWRRIVWTPSTAKLVHYNADTAAPENDIAESIETKDNQTFTVKLKPGYKFHDGTEVKAKNFVDAWNYTAYGPNGQSERLLLRADRGLRRPAVRHRSRGRDCEGKPAKAKEHDRPQGRRRPHLHDQDHRARSRTCRCGSATTAFAPLPDSFFADPKAYGEKPIGAGPFKLDEQDNTEIVLSKFADYSGDSKPQRRQGDLPDLPGLRRRLQRRRGQQPRLHRRASRRPARSATRTRRTCLTATPARGRPVIQTITFSPIDPTAEGQRPSCARRISMAIDRDLIIKQIFNGTVTPATGWVSPVVDGYKAGACGEYCTFDPAEGQGSLRRGRRLQGRHADA